MLTLLPLLAALCLAQTQQTPLQQHETQRHKTQQSPPINLLNTNLTTFIKSTLTHFHVPALSIAIIHNSTVHSAGYGTAIFPSTPATPSTMYYVGSTTKSFTAAALTLLMDDYANTSTAFGWKTPVVDFIRDDFVVSDEYVNAHATLEDLASHRTGFPRHDLSYGTKGHRSVRDTVRNMRHLPFVSGFRETYHYCNYMWATLGHVVETLTGQSEGVFLKERLWSKIGMHSTFWTLEDAKEAEHKEEGKVVARGYTWDEESKSYYSDPYLDIGPLAGAGSMISTVLDYAEYLKMMLSRSGPLSEEAHTQLRRARIFSEPDVKPPFAGVGSYALGWDVEPYRGVNLISHNGGLYGFGALMVYVPELNWGVAMLGNTAGTSNFAEEVVKWRLLDDLLGVTEEERYDWVAKYAKIINEAEEKVEKTRERVFGEVVQPPVKASLPLEEYEGFYWSDGYKGLNFTVGKASSKIPGLKDDDTQVLRASGMDRIWLGYIELEHVSGEFFVAWSVTPKGQEGSNEKGDDVVDSVGDGFAAEFRIGADGKPAELGIALEELMEGEKIWFKRM